GAGKSSTQRTQATLAGTASLWSRPGNFEAVGHVFEPVAVTGEVGLGRVLCRPARILAGEENVLLAGEALFVGDQLLGLGLRDDLLAARGVVHELAAARIDP